MTSCIIHIGMHKTGSTSIQRSLIGFQNDRVCFGSFDATGNYSLPVYSLFADHPGGHQLHRSRDPGLLNSYIGDARRHLEKSIADSKGRDFLISGEDISALSAPELKKLARYFQGHFGRIQIVAYVRPPAASVTSRFQERIKSGPITKFDFALKYRSYRATFERFDDVFGRENVELWKFDPGTFPDGCVVQDFSSRLALGFPNKRVRRLNESLSREAIITLYIYRTLAAKSGAKSLKGSEAAKLGSLLGGQKFRLSPDIIRPILDGNRADIRWMEDRLGTSVYEDLGEHRPGDVRDETDLLRAEPGLVAPLLQMLGTQAPNGVHGDTPEEIVAIVDAFLDSGALKASARPSRSGLGLLQRKHGAGLWGTKKSGLAPSSPGNGGDRRPGRPQMNRQFKVLAANMKAKNANAGVPWRSFAPLNQRTLIDPEHKIGIIWSPKCACTKVVYWYFRLTGHFDDALQFDVSPHKYRRFVLYESPQYLEWLRNTDWQTLKWYQFCRDPVKRALSSYRHNLSHGYADDEISRALGTTVSCVEGYSLHAFLQYLEKQELNGRCDVHVRLQRHAVFDSVDVEVINIDQVDMLDRMNWIEREHGLPPTAFDSIEAFRRDDRRRAKMITGQGYSATDVLNRTDARGAWPVDAAILDAATLDWIKRLYGRDMQFIYGPSRKPAPLELRANPV